MRLANVEIGPQGLAWYDKHGKRLTWAQARGKIRHRLSSYWLDAKLAMLNCLTWLPSHRLRKWLFGWAGMQIGADSFLHTGCRFYFPGNIRIGQGSIIGDRCFLDGRDVLEIGDHVDIASQVMIYNSQHDVHDEYFSPVSAPVKIEDYVFIGPRAIILPGVTLAKGCVVAAGAVVTKSVPPGKIVAGVPARVIGQRKLKHYHYRLGRPRLFQ